MAHNLYLYFYDMVNDGMKNDYAQGRNLFANPQKFLQDMKMEKSVADHMELPDSSTDEEDNSKTKAELYQEGIEGLKMINDNEREQIEEQDALPTPSNKSDSDFSASFYGPVFKSESDLSIATEVAVEEHRYFYVHETHDKSTRKGQKYENVDGLLEKMLRYFLLTFKDPKNRTCLHIAARYGDRHFTTMIVMEADYLQFADEIIDQKDSDELTPFYLLCEDGYRKKYDFDEDEAALLEGFEKTIAIEQTIDDNNDGMESDGSEELNIDKKEKKRIKREKDRKKQMERIVKLRALEKIR